MLKILKKGKAKVWLVPYIVQKAKIRYDWGVFSLKVARQGAVGVLLKMLK